MNNTPEESSLYYKGGQEEDLQAKSLSQHNGEQGELGKKNNLLL